MEEELIDREEQEKVFKYFNDLRESGEVNMFGAAPFLARDLGYDVSESREWLSKWMSEF